MYSSRYGDLSYLGEMGCDGLEERLPCFHIRVVEIMVDGYARHVVVYLISVSRIQAEAGFADRAYA